MANFADRSVSSLAFLRDVRFLRSLVQVIVLIVVVGLAIWLINNTSEGLARARIPTDFSFLTQPSGFQIDEGLVDQPHKRTDSYANAFGVALINTLRAVILSLILATLLGLFVGIARLSTNFLLRSLALAYIEIFQNTPLLLQLFFIFTGVLLTLPRATEPIVLPGPSYLSSSGLATPNLVATETTLWWLLLTIVGIGVGITLWQRLRTIRLETGRTTYAAEIGLGVMASVTVIAWLVLQPFTVDFPELGRFGYLRGKGAVISANFLAIVLGLVLYTGAFIAEIVRSGIQAVPIGQWEAARSQGFTYGQILRLIVIPQALRVMIPPLTNQYLNLAKNSSLGAAVGFAEVFGVARTMAQSVSVVPIMVIVMGIYLALSLITSAIMNVLNARFQIKTR
ncbi:MAG: ABC transporter permease subunit [Anaerolineae bacterium]|nr:ABC transporter permease subunit [Anaerolineae bacterium]